MNYDDSREKLLAELFPQFAGKFVVLTNWSQTYWFKFKYEEPGSTWIYIDGKRRLYTYEPEGHDDIETSKEDVLEILRQDKLKHMLEAL